MATVHKCDKCNKIIDTGFNYLSIRLSLAGRKADELNFPGDLMFCGECEKPVIKYLKNFLKN